MLPTPSYGLVLRCCQQLVLHHTIGFACVKTSSLHSLHQMPCECDGDFGMVVSLYCLVVVHVSENSHQVNSDLHNEAASNYKRNIKT
ncbi:hypothetical protein L798_06913 [Zootermopsis nevadensis]|uniref:Uncharacterized protein n=1 Tax=Zootermopsis nevadensis TaxID=136037 RepID=A0A067R6Y1_ZOONE|nr:hypothetical protein L798_06913 [Zootermopsis nevadensis]